MGFIRALIRISKSLIFIALVAIIIILAVSNPQTISISLNPLPYEIETKLFFMVAVLFLSGLIAGLLISSTSLIRTKVKNYSSQKQIKKLSRNIENQEKKPTSWL
jgi:uncharacterized membrane protein YciS (DUF1049 family)